ncbi:MAG: hypothetical protein AAFP78_04580, partial [Pseudomonadota bacterium]
FYGALLARKAEEIRSETARLSSAIDALRVSVSPRSTPGANELAQALTTATRSSLAEEKAAMAEAMDRLDAALAETQSMVDKLEGRESQARRAAKTVSGPKRLSDGEQPVLPFGATTDIDREGRPIPWQNVVRALDFPKDEKDVDGFAALRQVVADKEIADLLQASEDTLTVLAEEGLYMEDLKPQVAPIQTWLRYAEGARGAEVAALGGITDEVAVAISRGRLKRDAVFRDTALHFLRRFDALIERMARELGEDAMILEMGDKLEGRESQARRAAKTVSGPKRLSDGEQPVLPFGATTDIDREGRPIPWQNVVRALDFPKDEKDVDGFAALRQVVADKEIADLLQASEDTLTVLAEEGLYMEDLKPQVAPIQTWLRYAEGARGAEVAALGGITDEVAVAISRGRLKRDAVFRDTALHFLRRFDALIERMARELGEDAMILEMGDTRTGRAFMLTARISGAFD